LRTNSIAATDDYTTSQDYVVKNVPMETLQQFSEVGEIYPHLEFKRVIEKRNKFFLFQLKILCSEFVEANLKYRNP
jgi:hypothetical protein